MPRKVEQLYCLQHIFFFLDNSKSVLFKILDIAMHENNLWVQILMINMTEN